MVVPFGMLQKEVLLLPIKSYNAYLHKITAIFFGFNYTSSGLDRVSYNGLQ